MYKLQTMMLSFLVSLMISPALYAAVFECTISNVLRLNETGSLVTHEWSPNYQNRKFTVDKDSGKVIGTTALKVRLSNFDQHYQPELVTSGKKGDSYKAITIYKDTGQSAYLQINDVGSEKPRSFLYDTNIGMILTGTCVVN